VSYIAPTIASVSFCEAANTSLVLFVPSTVVEAVPLEAFELDDGQRGSETFMAKRD
jgi:hypothetical protein